MSGSRGWPVRTSAAILVCSFAGVLAAQESLPIKTFPDYDGVELLRAVPELTGIQFSASQAELYPLLEAAGGNLRSMLAGFIAVSAAEEIHEIRFEGNETAVTAQERFRYAAQFLVSGSQAVMDEFRTDPAQRRRVLPSRGGGFLVLGHFVELLNYLLPEYKDQSRFRYVGRLRSGGQDWRVVAFAQRGDSKSLQSHVVLDEDGRTAILHGLAWIDAATNRVARLHLELAEHVEQFPFSELSTDVVYTPVTFKASKAEPWLPSKATIHGRSAGGAVHTVHRFSDYRTFVERGDTAERGYPALPADTSEDAHEALARGLGATGSEKPAALREAVRLDPGLTSARYHLAVALYSTGDLPGAETELREVLKRAPSDGPAHNQLGIVLFRRGDVRDAVAEFRASAQLQPAEAVVQFNLGQALERLGDRQAALDAYRAALALAPDNGEYKARLERLEAMASPPAETTIRVDVRQVLVPVVVTDKAGHHATGLKQSDFRVFEDGVEQSITAFSSETGAAARVEAGEALNTEPKGGKAAPSARRTYVICLDTLHTASGNMARLRDALRGLFRTEQAGDSLYALVAVGSSARVLQNTTSDPGQVLKSLESQDFQQQLTNGQKNSTEAEMRRFRRTLDEVRALCDARDPTCETRKRSLPGEAEQIASQDRVYTAAFLQQLRDIVKQLSHATDRRTVVLISDGFQLVPGRDAFALLQGYFPEIPFLSFRTSERMQHEFEQVTALAANANITIHTVNSRGLYGQDFLDSSNAGGPARVMPVLRSVMNRSATDTAGTLTEIADATGGIAFRDSNDILSDLRRAFTDGREYYSLAYIPSNSNLDGTFRAITVQVRGSNLLVKSKRGYWATAQ